MSSSESDTRTRILAVTWYLLEEQGGQKVRMSDIAAAAGVSRQALYLHFRSRTDLLIATTHYVDQVHGLHERLQWFRKATRGVELLEVYVKFWGEYIPVIYGLEKALFAIREIDEAAAAAWNDRMMALREGCRCVIEGLHRDRMLAPPWSLDEAIDLCQTMLSVRNWEHLTLECGWSMQQYVDGMQALLRHALVREPAVM